MYVCIHTYTHIYIYMYMVIQQSLNVETIGHLQQPFVVAVTVAARGGTILGAESLKDQDAELGE